MPADHAVSRIADFANSIPLIQFNVRGLDLGLYAIPGGPVETA